MKYLRNYKSFKESNILNEKIIDKTGKVDPKVLEYWNSLYDKWLKKTLTSQEEKDYNNMTMVKLLRLNSKSGEFAKMDEKMLKIAWSRTIIEGFKVKFGKDIQEATEQEIDEWNYTMCEIFIIKTEEYTDNGKKGIRLNYDQNAPQDLLKTNPEVAKLYNKSLAFSYEDLPTLKDYAKNREKYFKDQTVLINQHLDEVEFPWEDICNELNVREIKSKPESSNLIKRFFNFIWTKVKAGYSWLERKSVQLIAFICTGDWDAFKDYGDLREDDLNELISREKNEEYYVRNGLGIIINIFKTIGEKNIDELKKIGKIHKLSDWKNPDKIYKQNKFYINDDIISVSKNNKYIINGEEFNFPNMPELHPKVQPPSIIGSPSVGENLLFSKLGLNYDFLEKYYEESVKSSIKPSKTYSKEFYNKNLFARFNPAYYDENGGLIPRDPNDRPLPTDRWTMPDTPLPEKKSDYLKLWFIKFLRNQIYRLKEQNIVEISNDVLEENLEKIEHELSFIDIESSKDVYKIENKIKLLSKPYSGINKQKRNLLTGRKVKTGKDTFTSNFVDILDKLISTDVKNTPSDLEKSAFYTEIMKKLTSSFDEGTSPSSFREVTKEEKMISVNNWKKKYVSKDKTPQVYQWIWINSYVKKYVEQTEKDKEGIKILLDYVKQLREMKSNKKDGTVSSSAISKELTTGTSKSPKQADNNWIWSKEYDVLLKFGFLPVKSDEEIQLIKKIKELKETRRNLKVTKPKTGDWKPNSKFISKI